MTSGTGAEKRSVGRISKTTVESLARPPEGGRASLWDTEIKGFGVRVTPSGRRTYVLRYRMGGRAAPQRYVTIGQHGSPLTAEQARRRAMELLAMVRAGQDPAAGREMARMEAERDAARRAERMFAVLAERWLRGHVRGRLRSEKDIEGVVARDLLPAFEGLTVDEITKAKVAEALEGVGERSEAAANKMHKWLRKLFNWLIEKGVVEASPVDRISRPYAEPSRDRALSLLEVTVVWHASGGLPPAFRDYYRFLLLTGQRLREGSNLPWEELDIQNAEWLLPAARSKNDRDHLVPLSDQALAVLADRRGGRNLPEGPVFTTDGQTGVAGFSKMKAALDEAVGRVLAAHPGASKLLRGAIPDWVVHDLRRTLATGCQAMGVRIEVTEAVLNHVSGRRGGLAGIYQVYDFFDEKADALARWGGLVSAAVARWEAGDFAGVMELDPVLSARRRRRAGRAGGGIAGE